MIFSEAQSYLLSLGHETLTIKLGLTNTERLLDALNNPHKSFPSVQIAGTNGKGSTAVMLESICRAARIRVGLFTSPHLVSITERIRIEGKEISELDFARLTAQVKQAADELVKRGRLATLPTFFEHVTAIALLAFCEAKVELAILETGLGGRLDSTTAAEAQIVAITPVAMDHEDYLGHTLAEIASEKAAIIRRGVTAVVAPQQEDASDVVLQRCREVGVTPRIVRQMDEFHPLPTESSSAPGCRFSLTSSSRDGSGCASFETPEQRFLNVCLGLQGWHQVMNAAIAIALAEALCERGFAISHQAIVSGLENARHPGRLELWEGAPSILFDGAHNPAAARALREYLDEFVHQPVTMIFGAMRDKALVEMEAILFPAARAVVLAEMDNPRAATIGDLRAAVPRDFDRTRLHEAKSVTDALRVARQISNADSLILVTGSLYLVGAAQQQLSERSHAAIDAKSH